jgi:hypothetical protein
LSSPCLWASFHPPIPSFSFSGIPQSKDILLNLSMKCCNSVWNAETQHLNAQGSRLIINSCTDQSKAVKIYVAAVEVGAQEKGKTGWNSVYHQNWRFSGANVIFCRFFFFVISPCVWPNSWPNSEFSGAVFVYRQLYCAFVIIIIIIPCSIWGSGPPYGGIFFHSSLIRCERTNTGPTEDPAFCKEVSRADKGAQNTKEKSRQFLTRNWWI